MTGTSTTITHAPCVNLVTAMTTSTTSDSTAPMPLTNRPLRQPGSFVREVVLGHARLRQGERREHADGVERDEPVDLGAGDDHEHDRRRTARKMMPFENTSRWPALGELAGHEVVAGVEAGQPGEVGEARVGREHEDEHRAGLQRVVEDVAERAAAVHELADLGDDGRRALLERRDVHLARPAIDSPRNMTPRREPMMTSVVAGVLPLRLLERGHAVGDRLDAGDRGAAGGERVQHHVERRAEEQPGARVCRTGASPRGRVVAVGRSPATSFDEADAEQHDHVDDEEVGRDREELPRLRDAAQVAERDDDDEQRPRSRPRTGASAGTADVERGRAGGDRHRRP